ncbi:MAG: hypothetical protein Q8O40_16245, partial [Chloroflexota bacterium]|nr:hypothetical protein [Chloroflexota bacterium]
SSPGRSKRASSSGDLLGFELLYQLAYLSAVAAAGIPRSQVFRLAAELPSTVSGYFLEIDRLARTMNYQYAEACRLVGESAKEPEIKSLLLRMAGSLSSGESEMDFLQHEAQVQAESYGNQYERKLESLRKWTDAYSALIVSATLIIVVAAISTVIYNMGTAFVTGLVTITVAISGLGAWVIFRTAPHEVKTLTGPQGQPSQRVPRLLLFTFLPGALATGALLFSSGASMGMVLMLGGLLMVPIGIASSKYDGRVTKHDADISSFFRVLGSTATAIGTTPAEAMGRIDLRAMASLAAPVKRLHERLKARAALQLAWGRFVTETGSELIGRSVRIFLDGVSLGGEPEEVGNRASVMTTKVNFMREKRTLIASTFGWLTVAMHATVSFLLVFVIEIVAGFGNMVQSAGVADLAMGGGAAGNSMISFSFQNMQFLHSLMAPVLIVLAVINALAAKAAEGGYIYKFFLYLGITLFISGLVITMAPRVAVMIFGMAPASGS